MRHHATRQSTKETPRNSQHEHIQRRALVTAKPLARIRRDVEVRHDVAEEGGEGTAREDEEERVADRGGIE